MALHLMTMNMQMLPWGVETAVQGMSNNAEEKAERIANDLLALPPASRPEVIAFNEVFDDEGREVLTQRLKALWPNFTDKITGLRLDDSGLILFSIFPFATFPDGSTLYQEMYDDAAGEDQLTAKGFGIVKINTPIAGTTIVFTHMQASSDEIEDEYDDIRAKQFQQIFAALGKVFEEDAGLWGRAILIGDLNVRGDKGAKAGEWAAVFGTSPTGNSFSPLLDGWRTFMLPPGVPTVIDEGYTQRNFGTGVLQRLDYMCFSRPQHSDIRLVPHRMFIRFNQQSDHYGLEGIIASPTPNCTPSDAIDILVSPGTLQSPTNPSTVRSIVLNFPVVGGFQWVYVRKPGTYSIWPTDANLQVFAQSDMSTPLARLDTVRWRDLPPSISGSSEKTYAQNPRGEVFVSREPFFIALRRVRLDTGTSFLKLIEHAGESPATAIGLQLHGTVDSTFPIGQMLGADDKCWFKATIAPVFTQLPRTEVFSSTNPGGLKLGIEVQDDGNAFIGGVSGSEDPVTLEVPLTAMPLIYLTLKRENLQVNGFNVSWISPVSYLCLDRPLGLYIDDETGVDRFGEDEPSVQINMDGDPFELYSGTWDDADTGEHWPNLDQSIRARINQRFPGATRIGFVSDISVSYVEPDLQAQGWLTELVPPLAQGEQESERRITLPVPDDFVSDCRYSFYCTLSLFP